MSSEKNSFGELFDMGLTTVKARQYQTTEEVVRQFTHFLNWDDTRPRREHLVGTEAVNSWRLRGIMPNVKYRHEVVELAVTFCTEKGMVSRWWAESILESVNHPRFQTILDTYFPPALSSPETLPHSIFEGFRPESDDTELRKLLGGSSEFWAWGTTFQGHVPYLKQLLEQALNREAKLKFLLIEPRSSAVAMAAFRAGLSSAGQLNATLEANLRQIYGLIPLSRPEMVELRVVDYLGPYTMYIFDRYSRSGQMLLHISSFHGRDPWDRPTLSLTRSGNTAWFEYFAHQFQRVWDVSKPYAPVP